jgi:Abortive infection alpha
MSPISTDLATHISEGVAIKFTTDLITKGISPALEEFGLTLKDRIHAYRWQNASSIIQDVLELLAQHDLTIQSVSPKVLISALESASLEDDPSLRQYWVALLASEFVGRKVHPRFPRILADLSPADAQILDTLDQQKYKFGFTAFELKQTHQVEEKVVQQTIDNLLYLGLLNEPPRPTRPHPRDTFEFPVIPTPPSSPGLHSGFVVHNPSYKMTELGYAFLATIRGPLPRDVADCSQL